MTDDRPTEFALPGFLAEIARITTPEIAVAVARAHGGARLYIPRTVKRDHPLARLVGLQAARLIAAHFPADTYDVPSARTWLRWYDARRLADQGLSRDAIARRLKINRKRVSVLLQGYTPAPAPAIDETAAGPRLCPICGHKAHGTRHRAGDARQLELGV